MSTQYSYQAKRLFEFFVFICLLLSWSSNFFGQASAQSSDDLISAQTQIEQAKVLLTTKYTFLVNE